MNVVMESQSTDEMGSAQNSESGEKVSIKGRQVKDLLIQEGRAKERTVANLVSELLSIALPTARRKLRGDTDFTETELAHIFDYAGFEYHGIWGIKRKNESTSISKYEPVYGQDYIEGNMNIAGDEKKCKIWLKKDDFPPAARGLFVVETNEGDYRVVDSKELQTGSKPLLIGKVEFIEPWQYEGSGALLGIYHENEAEVGTTAKSFRKAGFNTVGISNRVDLEKHLANGKFDAFFIEWMEWNDWSGPEIAKEVHAVLPDIPIVFLVGIDEGKNQELVDTAKAVNATILEQPKKTLDITNVLLKQIKSNRIKK